MTASRTILIALVFVGVTSVGTHHTANAETHVVLSDETQTGQPTWQDGFPSFQGNASEPGSPSTNAGGKTSNLTPVMTVATSLGIVLSLFGGLVWVSRKYGGKGSGGTLPTELIEPLGVMQLDPRTQIRLLRLHRRLIVVSQTSAGLQTLAEITDPAEVEDCLAQVQGKSRADFQATLETFTKEPTPPGFAEPTAPDTNEFAPQEIPRRGLFISG
ncbi:MAG: flagellar biosynthetic protein FliO [Planctomycetota bacterium]